MKKAISCLLVIVLIMSLTMSANAASVEKQRLSELTDAECIAFLKEKGVKIPSNYENETQWGSFVRETIQYVEDNPNIEFVYNYSVTQDFANAIKEVVNDYYGSNNGRATRSQPVYSLQDSTVYGAWTNDFLNYNCYAYAINKTDEWLEPGGKSGQPYDLNWSVYDVANCTKDDLEALGYTNVEICPAMPRLANLQIHEKVIAVRIKQGVDFHYMKFNVDAWYHKPGNTNTLKYNYTPTYNRNWTNEYSFRGEEHKGNVEYDSPIQYIVYTEPHSWGYEYCGNDSHIKTCTLCGETTGVALRCVYIDDACRLCGHCNFTTIDSIDAPVLYK